MTKLLSTFLSLLFLFSAIQLNSQGLQQCTSGNTNGSVTCAASCISCDLNGVTGRTDAFLPPGFTLCFSGIALEHPRWFGFIAGSTNLTLSVSFGNCSNGSGLEFALRENCFTEVACFPGPNQTGAGGNYVLPMTGLVIGRPYQFMVDGFQGDMCDFTISVVNGSTVGPALGPIGSISGLTQVCPNGTTTYSIAPVANAISYTWSAPAGASINGSGNVVMLPATGNNNSVEVTFGTAGGNVCVTASNACSTPLSTCLAVSNLPILPVQLPDLIVCNQEIPYEWAEAPNTILATPGTYNLTSAAYVSYLGCDSIVKQKITVLPPNVTNLPVKYLCKDECFNINGLDYCDSGPFQEILESQYGCDSIVNFSLVKIVSKAVIAQPDTITCAITSVPLSGVGSTTGNTVTYRWMNPDWQQISNNITATATMPGEYALIVNNFVGGVQCMDTAYVTVPGNLTPPEVEAGPNKVLTCVVTEVQLEGSGSSGPTYSYFWKAQPGNIVSGSTTLNPIVNAPGSYVLRVTNSYNGCTAVSVAHVVAQITPPLVTALGGTFTCSQPNITLQVATNAPNPSYLWNGPNNFVSSVKNPVVADPGTYTVTVTNGITGCTNTGVAQVIAGNNLPDLSATGGDITCVQNNVTLHASSSVSGVGFHWTGPNGFNSNMANPVVTLTGNYTVVITAPNGCTNSALVPVVLNNTPPGTTLTPSGSLNCVNNSINILASSIGNPADLQHTWSLPGGGTQNTGSAAFLATSTPGLYGVQVLNNDNGCISTASVTVFQFTNVSASIGQVINTDCYDSNDGSLSALPTGGNGIYSYHWSNGATTATNNGIGIGMYGVTVTDSEGCSATANGTVSSPPQLLPNATATGQTFVGAVDGTASANPSGGVPGYTYNWSTSATTPSITALMPGAYTVTITDSNNCTAVQTVNVSAYNCLLQSQLVLSNILCFGQSNGQATVNVQGGTDPVSIAWSNGATTDTIFNLQSGPYAVTITDGANCQEVQTFFMNEPVLLDANASGSTTSGGGIPDGSAASLPTGGTGTYSYLWSTGATTSSITNVLAGSYTVTVTDSNGCESVQIAEVLAGNCNLSTDLQLADPSCSNSADGSATLLLTGGAGGFTYAWSSGGSAPTESGLTVGTHTVTVTDANGCSIQVEAELQGPPALVLVLDSTEITSCANLPEGSAHISVSGGTGSLSVTWSDGQNGLNANNLTAGIFTAVVTDDNGCTASLPVEIMSEDNINPVIIPGSANVPIGPNGTVFLTAANTGSTITDNCLIASTVFEPAEFNCLQLGQHTVMVTATDNSGNSSSATLTINVVDNTPPTLICSPSMVVCSEDNPVAYQAPTATDNCLILGGSFSILAGLPIGALFPEGPTITTYAFTDAQGNVGTCSFEITVLTPLEIEVDTIYDDFNFQQIGAIFISLSGSLPPYTYSWTLNGQQVSTQQDLIGVGGGDYTLVVTDDNGCTVAIQTITISSTSPTSTPVGLNDILVYPNPTTGLLSVLLPDALINQKVFVQGYDQTGRRVLEQSSTNAKQIELDLFGLPDGLYSMVIRSGDQQIVRKIVFNK